MSETRHQGAAETLTAQSTADLVRRASEQITTLVRNELALARVEFAQKARHAGRGVGMFTGAGLIAGYGVAALLVAAGLGLALVLPGWLAALIVAGALLFVAGIAALMGRAQVRRAAPPVPTEAVSSVRADIAAVSSAVEKRSHR